MRHILVLTAAFGLLCGGVTTASAQKIDDKGRCHDAHGKYAKMDVCKGHTAPDHHYAMDKKGKCRDEKGHFATMGMCKH
jgi:hypothetical protein